MTAVGRNLFYRAAFWEAKTRFKNYPHPISNKNAIYQIELERRNVKNQNTNLPFFLRRRQSHPSEKKQKKTKQSSEIGTQSQHNCPKWKLSLLSYCEGARKKTHTQKHSHAKQWPNFLEAFTVLNDFQWGESEGYLSEWSRTHNN